MDPYFLSSYLNRMPLSKFGEIFIKKPISQLRPRMNVERLLAYINPVVRCVTTGVSDYGYETTSFGSRLPWSADVSLFQKAVAN